ncbi:MAG: hypothetical protein V4710_03360 [Verrucomicrobiota bacterium]
MRMEITCPSCGKLNRETPCQRCGCELNALFELSHAANEAVAEAAHALRRGQADAALENARRSWQLRHGKEAARIAFLASLALADFPGALLWRNRG